MKSLRPSTLLKLALLASDTSRAILLVSSYTFDPMNNSWKPSADRRNNNRSHHSSSASSYSYAPAEPTPAMGVEFTYNEEDTDDTVRHHYTAWGVGGNGEENSNDPTFVPKKTMVEIQYNKKTGEVSLLDEEGVVTPEEYKRLMKAVKYSDEGGGGYIDGITASEQRLQSQERQEDVAVGTTLYVDPEDLDPTDIIDTEGQDLSVEDHPGSTPVATASQQEVEIYHYSQQVQDYSDPLTQYHQSEAVSLPASAETFNSYSIPQPPTENNYPVPQYQDYQYSQQPMQTASAVAEPTVDQYYQQQTAHQHAYAAEYYPTAVAEQPLPSTDDETTEEGYQDDGTYRSSRGFGFAHRRDFFGGSN